MKKLSIHGVVEGPPLLPTCKEFDAQGEIPVFLKVSQPCQNVEDKHTCFGNRPNMVSNLSVVDPVTAAATDNAKS